MDKYKVINVSCASCAARIEYELKKIPDIKYVNLDFSSLLLSIDGADEAEIKRRMDKAEPGSKIESIQSISKKEDKNPLRNELIKIGLVIILFIAGLSFREKLHNTPHHFAEYLFFITAYLLSGWNVLSKAFKNLFRGKVFDENFLMMIATLGAIVIHELPEAVGVMLFYNVGELLQGLAVRRSRNSIKSLMKIRPDYANLLVNNELRKIDPDDVKIGDIILIKPGEKIPLDGNIIEGNSFVDTFALTGESVPRKVKENSEVLAGMINKTGSFKVEVTKPFGETSLAKIFHLVETATQNKAKSERFISTFAGWYTPIVVIIALGIAFIPPIFAGGLLSDWVYRALVILVISCPCALVINIPLGYFGGIGGASRKGILIKGSNFLDALTEVKTIVFDKTGTLTKGVFKVTDVVIKNGFSKEEIIKFAAAAESHSIHPIAQSIKEAAQDYTNGISINNFQDISGHGIKAFGNDLEIIAGNDRLLHKENIEHDICRVEGTVVHIAVNKKYAGYLIISDEIKEDSSDAIKNLKDEGLNESIMLTGDNEASAKLIAGKLGIKKYFYELLPHQKVEHIERLIKEIKGKGKVAFVGDGINDAPVLARADVGIAMGGAGSDAAVEAADIVIMEDHPSKIVDAIKISKKTRRIVWQNIAFALGVKGFFIVMGSFGLATMWEAVFADMGVALLAILNSTRMLKKG